jgi:hypothetical protein
MIKNILAASIATVLVYILLAFAGDAVGETMDQVSLLGIFDLALAAVATFVAFFIGARIGGNAFLWPGLILFAALQVIGAMRVTRALEDIAVVAGQTSPHTWASIIVSNWALTLTGLIGCIVGLLIGARTSTKPSLAEWNAS